MLQQEARVLWMTDLRLIDEKSFGEQNSSGFERAREFGKQSAIEKVHIDDRVERSITKGESIEVGEQRPYREVFGACVLRQRAHRDGREIRRDDVHSSARECDSVSSASRGHIEHESAARKQRHHFGDEGLGLATGGLAAMRRFPLNALA